jgi:hypothetical protein
VDPDPHPHQSDQLDSHQFADEKPKFMEYEQDPDPHHRDAYPVIHNMAGAKPIRILVRL